MTPLEILIMGAGNDIILTHDSSSTGFDLRIWILLYSDILDTADIDSRGSYYLNLHRDDLDPAFSYIQDLILESRNW